MSQLRELNAGDLMDLADIVAECWDHIDHSKIAAVANAKEGEEADEARSEIGRDIVGVLLKHGRWPLFQFVANLHDESLEEFKKRPPSAVLDAVESIIQSEEGRDFFKRLPELLKTAGAS